MSLEDRRFMADSYELGADLQAVFVDDVFAENALDLVGLEIEVGGGREDAGQRGELRRDEAGDVLQRVAPR